MHKKIYESPQVRSFAWQAECAVLQASVSTNRNGYGDRIDNEWSNVLMEGGLL